MPIICLVGSSVLIVVTLQLDDSIHTLSNDPKMGTFVASNIAPLWDKFRYWILGALFLGGAVAMLVIPLRMIWGWPKPKPYLDNK